MAIKIRWKRKVDNRMHSYGHIDYEKKLIRVNKKKSKKNPMKVRPVNKHATRYPDILDSIVHEELHRKHPKMREKTVRRKAGVLVRKLSPKQKKSYYSLYS